MQLWRDCVDPNATPLIKDQNLSVLVGVDASTKRDSTALVAVAADSQTGAVKLVNHKIFQPTKSEPLDFAATVEATLLEWRQRYALRGVYYDPYQMASTAQRLQKAGIRMVEFAQTPANLTAIGSNLFELIRARSIVAYPDNAISTALSHAIVKESSRGLQITKEKSSHKIDVVVALAMATYAAVKSARVLDEPGHVAPAILFADGTWSDETGRPQSAHAAWARQFYRGGTDSFAPIGGRTSSIPPGSGRKEW
jgi:phage terminase large subunit-like protein